MPTDATGSIGSFLISSPPGPCDQDAAEYHAHTTEAEDAKVAGVVVAGLGAMKKGSVSGIIGAPLAATALSADGTLRRVEADTGHAAEEAGCAYLHSSEQVQ